MLEGCVFGCSFVFKDLESLQFGQIRVISRLLVIGQEEGNMQMLLYVSFKCALLDQKNN